MNNFDAAPLNALFVRLKGLEPPRREASDPKSDVATNYTTAANLCAKVGYWIDICNSCYGFSSGFWASLSFQRMYSIAFSM